MSTATLRAKRYRRKYRVQETPIRYKKLLPVMYPQMRQALINWDELELLLFPVMEALGIDPSQYPYYMAWAKRKAKAGLKFSSVTEAEEWLCLEDEFETRGLNPLFLVELEPYVEQWVNERKTEAYYGDLRVTDLVYDVVEWNRFGADPYLDDNDGDASYIWTDGSPRTISYFTFAPTSASGFSKVELHLVVRNALALSLVCNIYLWDGSSWVLAFAVGIADPEWIEVSGDVSSILNSISKINTARMKIQSYDGGGDARITYAFLRVFTP